MLPFKHLFFHLPWCPVNVGAVNIIVIIMHHICTAERWSCHTRQSPNAVGRRNGPVKKVSFTFNRAHERNDCGEKGTSRTAQTASSAIEETIVYYRPRQTESQEYVLHESETQIDITILFPYARTYGRTFVIK